MAQVQVILKEKIAALGAEADIVSVKAGYARNFLVPQGKAFEATQGNLRHVANLKAKRAEREGRELADAHNLAGKIRKLNLKLELSTSQAGKAFGSITNMDIARALEEQKITVDRHAIQLDKPIKGTGKFEVPVRIHPDVEAIIRVTVNAAATADEVEVADEE
ncbi:MAG: 50S ribosomal protein L9 [Verrucomicrobiales bacterium]|nr:50S ribosomal protein L9 [Verrucomicrobiales bacterium]